MMSQHEDDKDQNSSGEKVLASGVTLMQSEPKIQVYEWNDQFKDANTDEISVHFQVLVMQGGAIYVWLGNDRVPLATDITKSNRGIGSSNGGGDLQMNQMESLSRKIAQRLTMKMVDHLVSYVSYNCQPLEHLQLQMFCERQVLLKLREIGLIGPPPPESAAAAMTTNTTSDESRLQ